MEFLNYHHLRYFWVAAKEGGLTRAAEKLRVSQPSICTQIQALERALGDKLLRRTPRGLALTEAGQKVFSFAEEIFSLGDELLSTMKQRPTNRSLRVNIGITDSLPKLLTYEMLKPIFHLPQPVQASCWEGKVPDLLAQLATYRLDVVLADEPAPASGSFKTFNHLLAATDGLGFFALPSLVAGEAVTRYGVRIIGRALECIQQFYAISAERRLTHPAVMALTAQAKLALPR